MALENGKITNLMKSEIIPLAGDASSRKFYRFKLNNKSQIIVLATKQKYKNLIAYSAINKFLISHNILAPKLYKKNFRKGIVVIEDFGDFSFHKILSKKKNQIKNYKKLIDLLIKIQKIKPKLKIKSFGHKSHKIGKYSKKYLHQESDLFFEWYLPLFFTNKKIRKIKKKIRKILSNLYDELNFSNSCFVHRDYHSQNLIKVGNRIGVIDSQDALIGNPAYDLASLIDDVRIKTSFKLKKKLFNYYLKKAPVKYKSEFKNFLEDFNILSVQRSLKIIGIFSRLFKRDGKKQYLSFIPYTWKLLEARMRSEIFSELQKLLNRNIPKKIRNKIIK